MQNTLTDTVTERVPLGQAQVGMTSHLPTRTAKGELVLLIDGQRLKDYAKAYTMTGMLRYSVFYA